MRKGLARRRYIVGGTVLKYCIPVKFYALFLATASTARWGHQAYVHWSKRYGTLCIKLKATTTSSTSLQTPSCTRNGTRGRFSLFWRNEMPWLKRQEAMTSTIPVDCEQERVNMVRKSGIWRLEDKTTAIYCKSFVLLVTRWCSAFLQSYSDLILDYSRFRFCHWCIAISNKSMKHVEKWAILDKHQPSKVLEPALPWEYRKTGRIDTGLPRSAIPVWNTDARHLMIPYWWP